MQPLSFRHNFDAQFGAIFHLNYLEEMESFCDDQNTLKNSCATINEGRYKWMGAVSYDIFDTSPIHV